MPKYFVIDADRLRHLKRTTRLTMFDWSKAERVRLPNLKSSTTTISLRVPTSVLERIKIAANKRDMPYQSLIKSWLAEKVEPARDAMDSHEGLNEPRAKFRSAPVSAAVKRRPSKDR